MSNRLLLTGAGFSRNWGGWLGAEVFEHLIGSAKISHLVRQKLWDYRANGFEVALGHFQLQPPGSPDLPGFNEAIAEMFSAMNSGFQEQLDTPTTNDVTSFLGQFEAIFTVNQDLLLEQRYAGRRALGIDWGVPGVRPVEPTRPFANPRAAMMTALSEKEFRLDTDQPYIKLHGSSNFLAGADGRALMIMGTQKVGDLNRSPLLSWYYELFLQHLNRPGTSLMIIGYSFQDAHINAAIQNATRQSGLRLFIVDPLGLDVLDPNRNVTGPHEEDPLVEMGRRAVLGASRRNLRETLRGDNTMELSKISRFHQTPEQHAPR